MENNLKVEMIYKDKLMEIIDFAIKATGQDDEYFTGFCNRFGLY